jgi:purine-binding chemotaxis protein CheW
MAYRVRHDPSKSLVGFRVGDVTYAISIFAVKEIITPLTVVPMPAAPFAVSGVAEYRGVVVAVIDLRQRFGLPSLTTTRKTKWLIVDVGEEGHIPHPSALVVDEVTEVFGTYGANLLPPPVLGDNDSRGILGVTQRDDRLVFVLDTTSLRRLTEPLAAMLALGREVSPLLGGGS